MILFSFPRLNKTLLHKIPVGMSLWVFFFSVMLPPQASAKAGEYDCKTVGNDWVWFSDHVALRAKYRVIGPKNQKYIVGTGVSFRGKPRGKKQTLEGNAVITAYGAGSLHIKSSSLEKIKICVGGEGINPITIYKKEF